MKVKRSKWKTLLTLTVFCLSTVFLYGFALTNDFAGTRIAEAATSWNIGTDGDLLITSGGEYYVTGSTAANTITVNTTDPVSITLDNVSIDVSGTAGKCAFDSGTDVTLYLKGTNSLKSGDLTLEGLLGQPGLKVQENECLVIYEDSAAAGSLTATGGNRGAGIGGEGGKDGGTVTIESGTVTAVGGLFAAGIGGGGDVYVNNAYVSAGGSGGSLTVNGGIVTATGGKQGAGIGSGVGEPNVETVESGVTIINGGTVTATGGELGAGIGGGCYRDNGTFSISGGTVTANGGSSGGAGVGGGYIGAGGTVTIQGGELIANGGGAGAGIGGGCYASGAAVQIQNATVSATGGSGGAGIGSGAGAIDVVNSGTVNIISGTVMAVGGSNGAGIGGGERNNGAEVTINGGTVTATGGTKGPGIGGGASSVSPGGFNTITHGGRLTVNDGVVTASGGQYSAGIGGSYWGSGAEVIINGGRVEAYGSGWGAGIGSGGYGGQYGIAGTATINNGYVKAVGGESAAGIGGGYLSLGGTVNVSGGEVIAQGGYDGAGIGGGREKAGGTVTITGGSIAATGGHFSAGIGGGAYGLGGTVAISNGTVTAVGGTNGAGIGAGQNSAGGSVTITGGSIKAVGNNSDDIGGSGGARGTGTLTNGIEPLERRVMENSVAGEDPETVNIQLTVTRSTPYDYSYVYNYAGKGHGAGDTNLYFYLPVRIPTGLSLASSPNPSTWGETVTLTADLDAAAATGSVKFFDGDVFLNTAALMNGQASFNTASLLPGIHALRAEYLGDEFYAPSATTVDLSQTVNKLPTIVTLSGSPNPAALGTAVSFTATVDPAAASGSVKFYDGETLIGTLSLTDGGAVLTTGALSLGMHSIKAVYPGDDYYAAGNSNVVEQEITKVPTTITLTSSQNPSGFGETVTFTAAVDPFAAVGSIDFYDNGVWVGRSPIAEGQAVFTTYYSMTLGSHSITAEYAGSEIYAPGISNVLDQSVRVAAAVTLTSSPNPSVVGETVKLTARIEPAAAGGQVEFYQGETLLGSADVQNGTAILETPALPVGTHQLTAQYLGDGSNSAGLSKVLTQEVLQQTVAVNLTSSQNPSTVGENVVFTAQVEPAAAGGQIEFFDGAVLLGTQEISAGRASFETAELTAGVHTITARYSGSAEFAVSTSDPLSQQVLNTGVYYVSVSANDSLAGVVSGSGIFLPKAKVSVMAKANPGYSFVNWTEAGQIVSTKEIYSFKMTAANRYLTANFVKSGTMHAVTVSPDPGTNGGSVSGGGIYAEGAAVIVTATPYSGYSFDRWTEEGQVVSTEAEYAFSMGDTDRNLMAYFRSIPVWPAEITLSYSELTSTSLNLLISEPVTDAIAYRVYLNGVFLQEYPPAASYPVTGLTPNKNYTFKMQAVFEGNQETQDGPTLKVKTSRR